MKLIRRLHWTLLTIALLGAFTVPASAVGQTYAIDPYHTQVYFTWNHAGFSAPGAVVNASKGVLLWNAKEPSQSSVRVTVPLTSIDTQVPVLDTLLRSKFFEVDQYPTATFKSTSVQRIGLSDHYRVKGQLTLHGVTNPVTLNVTLNKIGKLPMLKAPAMGFDATTTVSRSAFGLGQYVPLVSDRIHIHITAAAVAPDALAKEKQKVEALMKTINAQTQSDQ